MHNVCYNKNIIECFHQLESVLMCAHKMPLVVPTLRLRTLPSDFQYRFWP